MTRSGVAILRKSGGAPFPHRKMVATSRLIRRKNGTS